MTISIPIISEFNGAGISKAKAEFKQLEGAGAKAGFAMKKAFLPATAAIGALAVGLFDATKGAIEDAAAQDLLANTLRKATGATDAQIAANEDFISTQGKLLGITDDELRPVLGRLARATGSVTDAQKLATQAMDIAAATGKPLTAVTAALEKAYGGNMTALQRLAPEYRQLIKDGASFDEVMTALSVTTGGAATEAANTAQGQFKRLGVALNETKESIGAALLPAVEAALPILQKLGQWASDHPTVFLAIGAAIAGIAAAIVAVNIAMALNPFSLIAAAVVGLGALLVVAYQKFQPFRTAVDAVFGAIKFGVTEVAIPYIKLLLNVWKTVFNGIASIWNNTLGKIGFDIPNWVPGIGGKGFSFPKIPMLAQGGIISQATLAIVGESGPEAVIPLDRMGDFGMGGGGNNVTINVNGGDPEAIVDALRMYMFRNGSVPIKVSA
jgi:hypothetical protein